MLIAKNEQTEFSERRRLIRKENVPMIVGTLMFDINTVRAQPPSMLFCCFVSESLGGLHVDALELAWWPPDGGRK